MSNTAKNIEELVYILTSLVVRPIFDDEVWQLYGYSKRPIHGSYLDKLFPNRYILENYIFDEIAIMSLVDVSCGIIKSSITSDEKVVIILGIIDNLLSSMPKKCHPDTFVDNFISTYSVHLRTDIDKIHIPILMKAKESLNETNFNRFVLGTVKLIAIHGKKDFILNSDYCKTMAEKSNKEGRVGLTLQSPQRERYMNQIDALLITEKDLMNAK